MIGEADIQQLRNEIGLLQRRVKATEFSIGIEYLTALLDTLTAALKVVAVQKKIMARWYHGNPLGEVRWKEAMDAMVPFQEKPEKGAL